MADAPRDLVHQLRAVDGALSQVSAGCALEERILERVDAPRRRGRAPLLLAGASALAVATLVLWRAGPDDDSVARAPAANMSTAAQDALAVKGVTGVNQTDHATAPHPIAPNATANGSDGAVPSSVAATAPRSPTDEALALAPLEPALGAVPTAVNRVAQPEASHGVRPRDAGIVQRRRAHAEQHAERATPLAAVAVLSDEGVPAALLRIKELRASGAHDELVRLADALLARRLDARERETVSFERARALVRLDRTDNGVACRALEQHARQFPTSAEDVAPLRTRARCP